MYAEVEATYREKYLKQEDEAKEAWANVSKLRYELSFLKAEYEHDKAEHARQMQEVKLHNDLEVRPKGFLNVNDIIIIAFKCAIQDFLQSPQCAANCLQLVRSSGPGAIVCKSHATHQALFMCNMSCCEPDGTKGQLSY